MRLGECCLKCPAALICVSSNVEAVAHRGESETDITIMWKTAVTFVPRGGRLTRTRYDHPYSPDYCVAIFNSLRNPISTSCPLIRDISAVRVEGVRRRE